MLYSICPDVFLGHMIPLVVLMSLKGIVFRIFIDAIRMYVLCQGNANFVLDHRYKCYETLILLLPVQKYTTVPHSKYLVSIMLSQIISLVLILTVSIQRDTVYNQTYCFL